MVGGFLGATAIIATSHHYGLQTGTVVVELFSYHLIQHLIMSLLR
jgi:hypothetical protein